MSNSVMKQVEDLKEKYIRIWWDIDKSYDISLKKYTKREKIANGKLLDNFIKRLNILFEEYEKEKELEFISRCKSLVLEAVTLFLGSDKEFIDNYFDKITDVTLAFIKKVHELDEDMKNDDIFQAIRNVWIMNILQIFMGKEVSFTQSIYAYSMLYPYTDNFMDSKEFSLEDKKSASKRLSMRLKGFIPENCSQSENKVYSLIGMIEKQYPREQYKPLHESILCIHDAQIKSLLQQSKKQTPYETDLLGISIIKGSCSVVADAYLIKGDITPKEFEFSFIFGTILQFLDDLQDINEDIKNEHMTIFSQIAEYCKVDGIVKKLINLITTMLNPENDSIPIKKVLLKLMRDNCLAMVVEAVCRNKRYFTKEFLNEIQTYSFFTFSYLGSINKKFKVIEKNAIQVKL